MDKIVEEIRVTKAKMKTRIGEKFQTSTQYNTI